jgi:predicted transcriptional regulator
MKTTIEIPDPIFREIKTLARERGTTFREVTEAALRRFLDEERARRQGFELRDASVGGRGVQEGISEGDWAALRELVYEGRGG